MGWDRYVINLEKLKDITKCKCKSCLDPDLNKSVVKRHLWDNWGNWDTDWIFDIEKLLLIFRYVTVIILVMF